MTTAPIGCLDERDAFEAWVLTQPGGTEYAIRRRDIPGSGRLGHYVEPSVDFAWQAICARSASRQEGWKLVPTTLTEEMHVAAVRTILRCTGNDDFPPRVYRAMLAAAPHQSQEAQGDSNA